jgi:phosphoglycerate dehydrogenase-like enzyme
MRKDAFLVNIARGEIIQEDALIRALREGWIAGAALDVFAEEPLPSDHPFYGLDNVMITPHMAGMTDEHDERLATLFAENLKRYLAGDPLLNLVDRQKEY